MNSFKIPVNLKQLISSNQAFHYRIIPKSMDNGEVVFYTDQVITDDFLQELTIILGKEVSLVSESGKNINAYLSYNYRKTSAEKQQKLNYEEDFLERLISTAKNFGSSDIHIEPYEENARVRFRLDGKLKEQYKIAKNEYPQLINQIKIQSGMDIAENRLAQDGRITFKNSVDEFDIRVSSMPTLYGEKIVLRLLNRNTQDINLLDLGFTEQELNLYLEATKKPQGIILISGPTGSGKTTTLYATLKKLNQETANILTIEDPIEYTLEGINQVQLRENIGFNFPAALRTFLRQDPDIIMVGEIRDNDTAAMAIKAALTGHLVLSTIHTNSAWATISRLIDMQIPAFLLANTLNMSIAQRLVRKLCKNCCEQVSASVEDFPFNYELPEGLDRYYKAVGCDECYHTGYLGRKAIYEILPVTKKLEDHIRLNDLQIEEYLKENNISSLHDNALRLVVEGETSVEEVYAILANN